MSSLGTRGKENKTESIKSNANYVALEFEVVLICYDGLC